MAWLNPLALAGLLAAAGPLIVHLLRRQRAARLPFPSLRFVREARTAAVRLRLPSDVWLLLLRVAIVCGAAIALAQPLIVTRARRAAWDGRVSRAVVVDASASMAAAASDASQAADAEAGGAASSIRIDADRVRDGLARAVDALSSSPPSRREVVVISDFQLGSLDAAAIAGVPAAIGLRFVQVGPLPAAQEFRGGETLDAPGIDSVVPHVVATTEGTSVRLVGAAPARPPAITLVNAGAAGDTVTRAVARAGTPAARADAPLAMVFAAPAVGLPQSPTSPERPSSAVLRAILAMRRDRELAAAGKEHTRQGTLPGAPWIAVVRDASGTPVVAASGRANELLLHVAGSAGDYLSAVTLRSALISRDAPRWDEHEVRRISEAQRAAWTRPAEPPGPGTWRDAAPGDARWVWIAVLLLAGAETLVRKRRVRPRGAEVDVAAA